MLQLSLALSVLEIVVKFTYLIQLGYTIFFFKQINENYNYFAQSIEPFVNKRLNKNYYIKTKNTKKTPIFRLAFCIK
jgi:hypothetical protein